MVPAVGRDLVTRAGDRAHQRGLTLGYPAHDKERGVRVESSEQVEQLGHLRSHSRLEPLPIRPRHAGLERRDLEVFFDVDREVVRDHAGARCRVRVGRC